MKKSEQNLILLPCFCGNTDPHEFIIRKNKISCCQCTTNKVSSTSQSIEEMIGIWNTRGKSINREEMSYEQTHLMDSFFQKMCKELVANNHKGDMVTSWHPNAYQLIAETAYHMAKLQKAMLEVERGNSSEARFEVDEFAADVANYMAKITQVFGAILPNTIR